MTTVEDWEPLARALTERLRVDGVVGPVWQRAFEQTPRHVFVPTFYDDTWQEVRVDVDDPELRARALSTVYSDEVLVTQAQPARPGSSVRVPTSSSTMPGIMAWMLETLDVHDGHRVLEIGTGTGYNGALLCHRLGDGQVTSVDIDPGLVETAAGRLARLGYRPRLLAQHGTEPVPDALPFDRIICTAATDHIPPAWIDQLAPDGVIVTDLRGSFGGGMVRLTKTDEGTVTGRFDAYRAAFMPLRPGLDSPLRAGDQIGGVIDRRNPRRTTTALDPASLVKDRDFEFFLQLHLAGSYFRGLYLAAGCLEGSCPDGSWLEIGTTAGADGYPVTSHGSLRLWDTIETAYTLWRRLDQPTVDRFGVTATDDPDDQRIWLDDPDSSYSWPLPL